MAPGGIKPGAMQTARKIVDPIGTQKYLSDQGAVLDQTPKDGKFKLLQGDVTETGINIKHTSPRSEKSVWLCPL
jgi:hypothetical protein